MNFNGKIITALNMYGKSTQDGSPTPDSPIDIVSVTNPVVTLTGKNYFDEETVYASYSNDDGTYTTTGATFLSTRTVIPSDLLNQELTFSVYIDLTDSSITNVRVLGKENGTTVYGTSISAGNSGYSSVTFTPTASTDYIAITYGSGADHNVTVSRCQLEIGSSRTDFQDYVSEQYYIRKNMIDFDTWVSSIIVTRGTKSVSGNAITLTATSNDCYTSYSSGTYYPVYVEKNTYYTLSWEKTDESVSGYVYVFGYDGSTNNSIAYSRSSPITFNSGDYEQIRFRFGVATSGEAITYYNIQMQKGTSVTDYEEYKDIDDTLRAIPCTSGGNFTDSNGQMWYADEWDIVNGTITRYCQEVTLDGSSTTGIYLYSSYSGYYLGTSSISSGTMLKQNYGVGFCSHLTVKSTMSGDVGVAFGANSTSIYFPYMQTATDTSSVSEFATWLTSNPMTLIYPLAETTEESV